MKAKILFVLGGAILLVGMLVIEMVPIVGGLYIVRGQDLGGGSICSAWPYILGILAIVFVFWISRNSTVSGLPIDNSPRIIHLGYGRHDCDDLIMYAAAVAEARQTGRQLGAPIELVTPPGFSADRLDYDAQVNYQWLLDHPGNGVTVKGSK